MFKRKLTALDFHTPNNFNINDPKEFKSLVVWLEDQKIRHYKVEDRTGIRNIAHEDWQNNLKKYLEDLNFPYDCNDNQAVIDWLLGIAVRAEYGDNVDKYKEKTAENVLKNQVSVAPQIISTNPLDNLNFDDPEFKDGVNKISQLINVTKHPDCLVTLKALSRLIADRLSAEAIKNTTDAAPATDGKPFSLQDFYLGFDTGDYVLNNAAKILRLLYIRDLRDLQTKINEGIVAVQTITANPKTDNSLGKVGK